ncbi:unnamed protein product [Sphagnum balticum]
MTTHQGPDILAQLERLNLKTDNNTTAITQLAELMRFQMVQSERDRQQAAADREQAGRDRQTFQNSIREISQRVDDSIKQAEIDRNTFMDQVAEILEEIEELQERADRDREAVTADRQQAAIDRQQFQRSISELTQQFQTETRRIWEYLYLLQGRNGNTPQ